MDIVNSVIDAVGHDIAMTVEQNENVNRVTPNDNQGVISIKQVEDANPIETKTKFSIKSLISYCVTKSPLSRKGIASLGLLGLVKFLPTNYLILASTAIILWNIPKATDIVQPK